MPPHVSSESYSTGIPMQPWSSPRSKTEPPTSQIQNTRVLILSPDPIIRTGIDSISAIADNSALSSLDTLSKAVSSCRHATGCSCVSDSLNLWHFSADAESYAQARSPRSLSAPALSSLTPSLTLPSSRSSLSPTPVARALLHPRHHAKSKDARHLMEEQNKMMGEQGKTLKEHSKMLEALEKDATRDDTAHEGRGLKDESTWGALDKEALARLKILVDGWKDLMNVSLIFIALFLTVVTAFISPIIQLFSTPSSTKAKPPLPPTSLQLVALFYYLALMFSICNSVMCVLGLQWAGRLLSVPLGKTNLERALNRERRKVLAEQRLLPLMGVLFWTLLLSIAFFVIGFLIQLWALSFSFEERASILIVGAVAATALAITILGLILATTYHAAVHKNSPFESPLSSASVATWAWLKHVTTKPKNVSKIEKGGARQWSQQGFTIKCLKSLRHCIQDFSRWSVGKLPVSAGLPSLEEEKGPRDEAEPATQEEKPIEELLKEDEDDNENVQALKAYARLVINTNDAEVLERAVPSFEIGEWSKNGGDLLPVLLAVRERFLATDTSFRVKETVDKQLLRCRQWSGWRIYGYWRDDLEGNMITWWCRDHCAALARGAHESRRQFFSALVFFTSFDPGNSDLRGDPGIDSYEDSVARVLSSFDQEGTLGFRFFVFVTAVEECRSLLGVGNSDVTGILSLRGRPSLLRSLLRNPYIDWDEIKDIVAFITQGNEVAVLEELAEFFSNLPDIRLVWHDLLVIEFLASLIPLLPSNFSVPQYLDLSPTLSLFLRYQSDIPDSLSRYIDTLLYFLDHGGFGLLSSLLVAHEFFQFCLALSSDDNLLSTNNQDRAKFYLERHGALVALPPASPRDLQDLVDAIQLYQDNLTSEDLEGSFVDAVKECDSLCREGRQAEIKILLSHLDLASLPLLVLRCPGFSGRHISALINLIIQENGPEHVRTAPDVLANIPPMARSHGDLPVLSFLASLIPFLHPEYIVPPDFDLSQTLTRLMRSDPHEQTWRKHSDTLMLYLHRGAFDTLSDRASVGTFLDTCAESDTWAMRHWRQDQRTSAPTRERAIQLKEKLESLHADPCPAVDVPHALSTPREENKPRPMALQIWHAVTRRLKGIWRSGRKGGRLVAAGDVEMALKDQTET
ncbi:hypothetical protein SISNIDRAFT_486986 [Sistotremastrum niveocremeum HHB9708]|uniref:DUF6535 domain-containing protein n=1 Tax=Sistotremastrum niveocremeum HHB9708 TaxID=1314777 RepID=A0A164T3V0_9AGAM|nr:hypothetical protein SISNIDRAFT_486986 [Sistotremastrum niveocremeum HHB9708]